MPPLIREDWANHLIYGLVAFIVGAALAVGLAWPQYRTVAGLTACVMVGVAKEFVDYLANRKARAAGAMLTHTVDPLDAAFTLAGGLLGAIAAAVGAY